MRRVFGKTVSVLLLYICYVIIGMALPFFFLKPVEKTELPDIRGGKARAYIAEDNLDALNVRLALIDQAKKRIVFSVFDIREGKSTEDVFSHLVAAADRGVKVEIITDGMYGVLHMNNRRIFEACGAHDNITIRYYNVPNLLKPWSINGRMHDKYIIADDSYALLGGRNQFDYFLGNYRKNHGTDREVLLVCDENNENNTVHQVMEYYRQIKKEKCVKTVLNNQPDERELERLRKHCENGKKKKLPPEAEMMPVNGTALIHNGTSRFGKNPQIFSDIISLIEAEQGETIIETPYIVCSRDMRRAFEEAEKNGNNIALLINSIESGDNVCASADYLLRRGSILSTDMDVYEYMGKFSMHGKSAAIGKRMVVIGSYNFDCRSTYVDTETMLVLDSPEVNEKLRDNLERYREGALKLNKDGTYIMKNNVRPPDMKPMKKVTIVILSGLFQGFRYLI